MKVYFNINNYAIISLAKRSQFILQLKGKKRPYTQLSL